MSSKLTYLAGPITGASYDEATEWRTDAIARLAKHGIVGLSPMRGKAYLSGLDEIGDHYDEILSTAKGIVARDRWDCQRSDVVIVNFVGAGRVSIGSVMEIAWADAARVPIVLAMEKGNIHEHAMINEVIGFRTQTLDEALATAEAILR